MKKAIGKKDLVKVVPLSMSTIDKLEKEGKFPKRWFITDKRCAWNYDEVTEWLDKRQQESSSEFNGVKPPLEKRIYRPASRAA